MSISPTLSPTRSAPTPKIDEKVTSDESARDDEHNLNKNDQNFIININNVLFNNNLVNISDINLGVKGDSSLDSRLQTHSDFDSNSVRAEYEHHHHLHHPQIDNGNYFPLIICINICSNDEIIKVLEELKLNHLITKINSNLVEINCIDKNLTTNLLTKIYDIYDKKDVYLDYSNFISHPGNLFIKNLNSNLTNENSLIKFFNQHSKYASISSINLFNQNDENSDFFAIIKFENYLDVDYLLQNLDLTQNPFQYKNKLPLYINKYISKKERKLKNEDLNKFNANHSSSSVINSNIYDIIVLENLSKFLVNLTLKDFESFLDKFKIFNKIESIYFPINNINNEGIIEFGSFGYISFVNTNATTSNQSILKILYHLNGLSYDKFIDFTEEDIYDILLDLNKLDEDIDDTNESNIKISIAQHKHNHYLYKISSKLNSGQKFIYNQPNNDNDHLNLNVGFLHFYLHNSIIQKFSKLSNYQETNIYVNNFAILFKNNDYLWEKFWNQFGVNKIKSAKIIKPQFYNKRNEESLGKIGFVFYNNFKMAIRAILLTNNKLISLDPLNDNSILIQTSFAIQKNNNHNNHLHSSNNQLYHYNYPNNQRSSLPINYYPIENSSNNYMKRFSLPVNTDNFIYNHQALKPTSNNPNSPPHEEMNPFIMSNHPHILHSSNHSSASKQNLPPPSGPPLPSINPQSEYVNYYNPYIYYNYPMIPQDSNEFNDDAVTTIPPPGSQILPGPPGSTSQPIMSPFYYQSYYGFQPQLPSSSSSSSNDGRHYPNQYGGRY